jgi:hypothetical protein
MSADSPRLPTAEETIVTGLLSFRKKNIAEEEKINNVKTDLQHKFYDAQQQIITKFYAEVKTQISDTGVMPQEVSVDSDVKINLFNYYINRPQSEIYDIYENESNKACQRLKATLAERGFQIKKVDSRSQEWMRHVEDWDNHDTRYTHGCKFKLGPHKDYFPGEL